VAELGEPGAGARFGQKGSIPTLVGVFLCLWPLVSLLSIWRSLLGHWYSGALVIDSLLYARILVATAGVKLDATKSHRRRDFQGQVDPDDLLSLQTYCATDEGAWSPDQIRYFALSVLSPETVRRRLTDEYSPTRRSIQKTVTVEIELEDRLSVDSHGMTPLGEVDELGAPPHLPSRRSRCFCRANSPPQGAAI
jgi:hypothetical protein